MFGIVNWFLRYVINYNVRLGVFKVVTCVRGLFFMRGKVWSRWNGDLIRRDPGLDSFQRYLEAEEGLISR